MDYKSQHSGPAIDKAVADIQSVDLQKLNHYLGIFSDLGTRPVRGKQAGDYCYVGVSTDCDEHHWNGHAWTIAQTHLNLVGEINNIVQELGDNPRVAISQMAISQIIRDILAVDDEQTRNIADNAIAIADLQEVAEALNTLTTEHSNTISEYSNTLADHQAELNDHSQVLEEHQQELVNQADAISSLNEDIARINLTDTEQQKKIDSNTSRVASVEDRSSALEQQTTELNARTSELEFKSLRYKGVFADASLLPTDAMAGDYAYVGTDTTALAVYTFGAAWAATGEIVDLATVSNLDNIMPAEPSEHRAPTTALLASALATQKAETDTKLTELESEIGYIPLAKLSWINNRNINGDTGSLQYNGDTIASNDLVRITKNKKVIVLYNGTSENTIKFNLAFFNKDGVFLNRMLPYVDAGTEVDLPSDVQYVKVCLALYADNVSIGGDVSSYDLENTYLEYENSIKFRLKNDAINTEANTYTIERVQKDLRHSVVLLGNVDIQVTEPMVYGGDVTIKFSKKTERVFIVKLKGMVGAEIDILPPSMELIIPHNKNLWIDYVARELIVSDSMDLPNAIFMGRNYIGKLSGGVFGEILPHINKASVVELTDSVKTLNTKIKTINDSVSDYEIIFSDITASDYTFLNDSGINPDTGGFMGQSAIGCEKYFRVGNKVKEILFNYSDTNRNNLNISVSWYRKDKTFITRDSWHYLSERNYNTRPNDACYFRLVFGLYNSDFSVNLSNNQANYKLDNLIVKYVFNTTEQTEERIAYDGKPIMLKPRLDFKLLAQSSHTSALQGGAAFGKYYFQFHGQNNKDNQGQAVLFYGVEIFNLSTNTKVQEIILGFDVLKHNNSASFSNQYYDDSDTFPLLYVSQEDAEARYVVVYRVQGQEGSFTLTMVQVIYLPSTSEGANYYYPNSFVDLLSNRIVFSGFSNVDATKYTFQEWVLPSYHEGEDINIGKIVMRDGGNGSPIEADGFTLPNGNVVRRNDNDETTTIKAVKLEDKDSIKTFHISRINPYTNADATTQGGCMFDGKVYQSFGSENNSVLKVIDIEKENVVSTIDLTKIENAEPESVFVYDDKIGFACNGTGKINLLLT